MILKIENTQLFHEYFHDWAQLYKLEAVRPVTYRKYQMTFTRLAQLAPDLKICDLNKRNYQLLLNEYAKTHERQTTMDFHHHLKAAILDALDEGLLTRDPTRKVVIKGKTPNFVKNKFLNQYELQALLGVLELPEAPNWDWFILLTAKTGLRFSEALALTPKDFDFHRQRLSISKTWDYKNPKGGFADTKNPSSKRVLPIDRQLSGQFSQLTKKMPPNQLIFVKKRVFNSTVNDRLSALCRHAQIPKISIHCLRHTHASLLIFAGVSVGSIAKRLGHANVTTTQNTYLHIIRELEDQDHDKIMQHLSLFDDSGGETP